MDVRAEATRWLAEDPDPVTRAELAELLARGDDAALAERFGHALAFGTAGLRGALGAGSNRMNRCVVRRVTAGLAARLLAAAPDAKARGVVVGRDARHGSAAFADDAAAVLAGAGIRVRQFAEPVPTPLVAFAVRALEASAGVQITASHNPPSDNGYKIYDATGAQIAAPVDDEISAAVEAVGALRDVAYAAGSPLIEPIPPSVWTAYQDAALRLSPQPHCRGLRIAYTPLHGVAGAACLRLLRRAGFSDVHVVAEQAAPDPDFPTVAFPNPERPGVLDRVQQLGVAVGADLVLANDPDGDRIAAAVPLGDGRWRALTGDEIGCLLAEYLLAFGDSDGAGGRPAGGPAKVVATTVVSSRLLARIAAAHGAGYVETLTGFKWLARVAQDARAGGGRLVLAYEQALGVMAGDAVRDKDGLTAALLLAEMAAWLRAAGRTLLDALDDAARRFGVHLNQGWSVDLDAADGDRLVRRTLDRLRAARPQRLDDVAVTAVSDHAQGVRHLADGTDEPLSTPPTDLIGLTLADGTRLQIRPSGTEPLLKLYAEVVEPVVQGDLEAARARAANRLERRATAFERLAFPDR